MDKWKHIWNKDERINNIVLEMLIKADGFDSGAGSFTVKNWLEYVDELYQKIDIFDQTFKEYSNSKLRFNVIMEKM